MDERFTVTTRLNGSGWEWTVLLDGQPCAHSRKPCETQEEADVAANAWLTGLVWHILTKLR